MSCAREALTGATSTTLKGDQGDLEDELEREGVSAADASYYAEGLRQGGALVSVRAEDAHVDDAVEIMNRHTDTEDDFVDDAGYAAPLAGAETDTVDSGDIGRGTPWAWTPWAITRQLPVVAAR